MRMLKNDPPLYKAVYSVKLLYDFVECHYSRFVDINPELVVEYRIQIFNESAVLVFEQVFSGKLDISKI